MNLELAPTGLYDPAARESGQDWPAEAETMVGWKRLTHLERSAAEVVRSAIRGDLVEAGVWRGGASILMRAVLKALGDRARRVWLFDSFDGLPRPDSKVYPADQADTLANFNAYLGVSLERVQANFERYGLLDEQVRFVKGWFKDTIPNAPVEEIALLRADGDMYESTMQILEGLYPKVVPGGFVIIDDYGALENCRQAVHDFRSRHGISEEIQRIDWTGAFWRRS